jgi:hypothetical protein
MEPEFLLSLEFELEALLYISLIEAVTVLLQHYHFNFDHGKSDRQKLLDHQEA